MLKVMSFNIRYGTADDGDNRWERRKPLVIERIRAFDPDLLGLQECRDDAQAVFIREQLGSYEFLGVQRGGDSLTALEMAPILYKKDVFRKIQGGYFWLSDTPQVAGSTSWGSVFPRTAVWVQLQQHSISGRSLTFLNTHFDYQPSAIRGAAGLLKTWLHEALGRSPLLVTGDFNADKTSTAYTLLTEGSAMRDVFGPLHHGGPDGGTFHGYGSEEQPIDWILASSHFQVIRAGVDRHHEEGLYPSDHYPVTALLEWRA